MFVELNWFCFWEFHFFSEVHCGNNNNNNHNNHNSKASSGPEHRASQTVWPRIISSLRCVYSWHMVLCPRETECYMPVEKVSPRLSALRTLQMLMPAHVFGIMQSNKNTILPSVEMNLIPKLNPSSYNRKYLENACQEG